MAEAGKSQFRGVRVVGRGHTSTAQHDSLGRSKVESADRLTKVEMIRERTGLSYAEAAALLDEAEGDVLGALILHEQRSQAQGTRTAQWEVFETKGHELAAKIKELVKRGNVTKVRIKRDGRTLAELPVTAGVVGAVVSPHLALLGSAACLLGRCSIEIERDDEAPTVVNFDGHEGPQEC
jgi:hypothetical protein